MKDRNRHISLARICRVLGMSRQAYYQHWWHTETITIEHELVLKKVIEMRTDHRHMGTRKLYELIQPFLMEHHIKIGRDTLFDLLSANGVIGQKVQAKDLNNKFLPHV